MSDDFETELKQGFLEEASQLLADVEQCFLALEANPKDQPTIEKIFRIAHNIKGSSKAVGFNELGAFTHEFESYLLKCKNGELPIGPAVVSLMLKCSDHVSQFVQALKVDFLAQLDGSALIEEIKNFQADSATEEPAAAAEEAEREDPAPVPAEAATETVAPEAVASEPVASAVAASEEDKAEEIKAEEVTTEEFISPEEIAALKRMEAPSERDPIKSDAAVPASDPLPKSPVPAPPSSPPASAGAPPPRTPVADESIRVSLSRVEKLLNFVGEMVILQTVLKEQCLAPDPRLLRRTVEQMGKVTKEVQEISMGLRMVPLRQTFQKMQRIVRDTSASLGKKVNLRLEGEDTEVDKTVLESLGDPLVHLVRNAVDHGIEAPEERVAKGKPETGTIVLRSYHQSGRLIIEVRDDGGGIPAQRLREKAIEKGILKPTQQISDADAINLIFHPGFSTKAQVTEVSGRGVGMDVVKTNIEQMQGQVVVETTLGAGSLFKVMLPLTLAIIDGMVVRCGDERFVVPLSHVHESVKSEAKDLRTTTGLGDVLFLRGENLPVFRLAQALGRKAEAAGKAKAHSIAIIVRSQGRPFAALVDDIIGQQQVVIKKLGSEVEKIPGYSGSAILGDGRPALILELGELVSRQRTKAG